MRLSVLAATAALALLPAVASAKIVMTFEEIGSDVVASFSGSIDLTGASIYYSAGAPDAAVAPSLNILVVGAGTFGTFYSTGALDGMLFDSAVTDVSSTTTRTGDLAGLRADAIFLPYNYSGSEITGSATWTGTTIIGMGLNPGSYVFTLPNDTMEIEVAGVSSVPLPAAAPMLLGALGLMGAAARRRKS